MRSCMIGTTELLLCG